MQSILFASLCFASFALVTPIARAAESTLLEQYGKMLDQSAVPAAAIPCKGPDFKSKSPLRRFRKNIESHHGTIQAPNFAGKFVLVENPLSSGSEWFITDCASGKYVGTFPRSGPLLFRPDSTVVVTRLFNPTDTVSSFVKTAYGLPEIYVWNGVVFKKLLNEIQPGK